jgi:uncharacterized membrane protein
MLFCCYAGVSVVYSSKYSNESGGLSLRKSFFSPKGLALSAAIAAVYAVLTYVLAPISYGPVQFRVAEALTLLPVLMPQAIPGLFVGCLIANLLGGYGAADIIFGSLATLAAAVLTYRFRKNRYIAALPQVIVNAVVVGIMLHVVAGFELWATMGYVALGEAGAVYILGLPLLKAMEKIDLSRISS